MTSPSSRHPEPRPSRRVASLFDAAAAPGVGPAPGEEEALAAFRSGRRHRRMIHPRSFAAALAASATTAVLVTGGVSAAVPASVSDSARETAGHVLRSIGINVPAADPSPAPGRAVGPAATTPTEPAAGQDVPDQSEQPDDRGFPGPATTAQRSGVDEQGHVSRRATTGDGARVVEDGGDVVGPATATDDTGVEEGTDASAPATAADGTVPEGTVTDGATPDGTATDGTATDGATDAATPASGEDLPSATATDDTDVQVGGDVAAPSTAPSSVGVEEGGEVSPSATPGDSQVGVQGHAPAERGRADEGRSRDGGRTSEAGGPGDGGNNGSAVEPGKSAARDDIGLLGAATAGDGWAATGRSYRY